MFFCFILLGILHFTLSQRGSLGFASFVFGSVLFLVSFVFAGTVDLKYFFFQGRRLSNKNKYLTKDNTHLKNLHKSITVFVGFLSQPGNGIPTAHDTA